MAATTSDAKRGGHLLFVLTLVAAGCGVLSPEEQLLTDFFEASRLYDTTVVARMSDVTFNPRVDGVVQDFQVENVEEDAGGQSERVVVQAQVRGPDAHVTPRRFVFTMQRRDGRWFIRSFEGS